MDVFKAAETGDLERVRALVEQDAGLVHAEDDQSRTALMWAAYGRHVEVARYLLDHGAAINHHTGAFNSTALHRAACPRMVLFLLERGADVTAVNEGGATALVEAACCGVDAAVRVLLEHGGSDVDWEDSDSFTACHNACEEGYSGILRQLLSAGADPTVREARLNNRTAGDIAATEGRQECVTILQEWDRAYLLQKARNLHDA